MSKETGFDAAATVRSQNTVSMVPSPVERLRALFDDEEQRPYIVPTCWNGLSARAIAKSGISRVAFLSGYCVAASKGYPDLGLVSQTEMTSMIRECVEALAEVATEAGETAIPLIADGDTGYGPPHILKRTVKAYARAQAACIMLEDQVAPKRCGHTVGKRICSFEEAVTRIRAAAEAREELRQTEGLDILILARTDACGDDMESLREAVRRLKAFRAAGADMTFLEAPRTMEQIKAYVSEVPGWKMYNSIKGGKSPMLTRKELKQLGYTIDTHPLELLPSVIGAELQAIAALKEGRSESTDGKTPSFSEVCSFLGFPRYREMEASFVGPRQ